MMVTGDDIRDIFAYGVARYPEEACGLLITAPHFFGTKRLREVRNSAEEPNANVVMTREDIEETLNSMIGDRSLYSGNLSRELVVWHTHPGGVVGPSRLDMEFKRSLGNTRCLVVTLPTGEAVQF